MSTEAHYDRVKHLEMIQGVINRLAGNSLAIKGWTAGLVTAVLAFAVEGNDPWRAVIAAVPLVALWILDAYYLNLERQYRKLFIEVADWSPDKRNWKMAYDSAQGDWPAALSESVIVFYLPLLLLIVGAALFIAKGPLTGT